MWDLLRFLGKKSIPLFLGAYEDPPLVLGEFKRSIVCFGGLENGALGLSGLIPDLSTWLVPLDLDIIRVKLATRDATPRLRCWGCGRDAGICEWDAELFFATYVLLKKSLLFLPP